MKLYNRVNKEELRKKLLEDNTPRTTLSFYKYHQIKNTALFRDHLYFNWSKIGVYGRIYIASEGVNGQVSVPTENLDDFKKEVKNITFFQEMRLNIAIEDDGKSFALLKIKIRNKIVADGLDDDSFDVTDRGTHLDAESFNEITNEEDTLLIDMRNHYESEVGYFKEALRPDVETFRESLPIVQSMLKGNEDRKIVMYCTGGIRCEKASAWFKHKGFKNVYQLDGGIIEYARQTASKGLENKFIGKNFVFDDRLGEKISEDIVSKCHQCGEASDDHTNCYNDACHMLFIQCHACAEKYEKCCSEKCKDFIQLPEEEQQKLKASTEFNGTKFGKGRYKAFRKNEDLLS